MSTLLHAAVEAAFADPNIATNGTMIMDGIRHPVRVIIRARRETEAILGAGVQLPTTFIRVLQRQVPRRPQRGDTVEIDVEAHPVAFRGQVYPVRTAEPDSVQAEWMLDVDTPT